MTLRHLSLDALNAPHPSAIRSDRQSTTELDGLHTIGQVLGVDGLSLENLKDPNKTLKGILIKGHRYVDPNTQKTH